MKYHNLLLIAVVTLFFTACNSPKQKRSSLKPQNLESQVFTINTEKDTVIVSKSGILLQIPAGAIKAATTNVDIELKEALTLGDMLKAGLNTNSGENLLASLGMFNLNTLTPNAEIVKNITATVPVKDVIEQAQTFKGNFNADSVLEWEVENSTNVLPGDSEEIQLGARLFRANCKSCHEINERATGPMLAGVTSRRSMDWIIQFTRDWEAMVYNVNDSSDHWHPDCVAVEVANSEPSSMGKYLELTDEDVIAIFKYVDSKTEESVPKINCADSCALYRAKVMLLEQRASELSKLYSPALTIKYDSIAGQTNLRNLTPIPQTNFLVDPNYSRNSAFYNVNIQAWGWYNIDVFAKEFPGLPDVSLSVDVDGFTKESMSVLLVVPSINILSQGGLINNSQTQIGFMYKDGKIKLPVGDTAYVVAQGERDGKFLFAAQGFKIAENNQLNLKPIESDTAVIGKYLAGISKGSLKTSVKEDVYNKGMDKVMNEFQALKKDAPKLCGCCLKLTVSTPF